MSGLLPLRGWDETMAQLIQITVKLTGKAAEAAGEDMLEYALVPPAKLEMLVELIQHKRPTLIGVLGSCRITINGANADRAALLSSGDEVTIIGPE